MEIEDISAKTESDGSSDQSGNIPAKDQSDESSDQLSEQSEETLEQEEPSAEEQASVPVSKKKTAVDRINELTRKMREAEREAEYWRSKANHEEQPITPVQRSQGRPRLEDYETSEAYEDALLEWNSGKVLSTLEERTRQSALNNIVRKFDEKANALREKHEDFDDVVNKPVFTETMKMVLLSRDPELAYKIGSDEKLADRIAKLPPQMQIFEIGKLEVQHELSKKVNKTTQSPAPIKPLGGIVSSGKDPKDMTDDEWYEWRKKERLKKLKGQ